MFDGLDSRQTSIELAYSTTGDWLFNTEEYTRWKSQRGLEESNGVFWIKGKPGAGKSTIMKHMFLHLKKSGRYLTAEHFFNARGSAHEKSLLGMLQSLVYHLLKLDGSKSLWAPFREIYDAKRRLNGGGSFKWTQNDLKDFLLQHLPTCKPSKPILILVDALDECDEREVQKMVEFLENLSHKARHGSASLKLRLRIGLSSRHYPEISMQRRIDLILDNLPGHNEDITAYINDKLNTDDYGISHSVIARSLGIFMWVVLVVRLLNETYDCGDVQRMREELKTTPTGLEELFERILIKGNQYIDATVLTLQWVLFCKDGPPSARELYFAVISGVKPESLSNLIHNGISDDIHKRIRDW
ncbi:hypothetical protein SMACR_08672 [Sordaria macrospora]|uniref:WGS project CABT00000000 data, contig 2.63 n=2 Tax=Sordaria macrospora TaxID=5147 RepID=F7WAL8_SORMK|nr:uncharacterized protein SMAC_08672 [Sordaria macrospora k-hell]KAA8629558.1 hypothetical protein SMACR_08672 [Sordaria macrospora]WPJ67305.1 hypothetical protein SMAC4_08672 [Sordaria macrospora]CCC14213.1 unnamed protein product [Sordaria macrospora k-hell]